MTVIVKVKDKIWDIFSMTIVRRGVKYCCFLISRRSGHSGSKTFFCWICMFPTEVNAFILVQQHRGSRHIEFCKVDCTTWKLTLQDIKRHRRNPKQSGVVAVDSCFAILGAHQSGATNREALLKKKPHTCVLEPWQTQTLTESRHITCPRESKSPSVALMSHEENTGLTKPTFEIWAKTLQTPHFQWASVARKRLRHVYEEEIKVIYFPYSWSLHSHSTLVLCKLVKIIHRYSEMKWRQLKTSKNLKYNSRLF